MSEKTFATTDYDLHIGRLIQLIRLRFGMSQKDLAAKTGVTFQQIQKYETGSNRISVSRLKSIADAFKMPVSVLLTEPDKTYLHDKDVLYVMTAMYRTTPNRRKLILQITNALTNMDK
ncbi:MAG: helix-turn-helix domain-containing protein [Muribaculaceae bacterium]|nr:helix-turn-helix domain-containing protein [Muribaculaceae bacterium]